MPMGSRKLSNHVGVREDYFLATTSLRSQDTCSISGYDKLSRTCYHSSDDVGTADVTKVVIIPVQSLCQYGEYLVDGANPVQDFQLTVSSYHVLYDKQGARLNSMPTETNAGSWCAGVIDKNQFIQVEFSSLVEATGIALQGRQFSVHHITSYKFLYSLDCVTFITYPNTNGTDMGFPGNTEKDTIVTTMLPYQVTARCVRINPQTWVNYISLRFDILGCY
ncbi:inactive carboxypeptidase-like protein X2 [Mya arenaria]|uniref:inactive carboxypeptidase-like protein X2 n=1 Tax=Mya arenaria TaxID=6604 RepID=UPI0022E5C53B|nr:inactive carboxypeptidase-like protein X2 [Mya arenaria]